MILEKLRKWLFGKPDQSLRLTGAHPVAERPDPESPNPIRFKVVSNGRHTTVTDLETGRAVYAYAIEFRHDYRGAGCPELTIKTYQQKFEYEGRGTVFIACPKCREEMKPVPGNAPLAVAGNHPTPEEIERGQRNVQAAYKFADDSQRDASRE